MHRLTLLAPLLQTLILRRRILQGDIGQFEMDQPLPPLGSGAAAVRVVRVPKGAEKI